MNVFKAICHKQIMFAVNFPKLTLKKLFLRTIKKVFKNGTWFKKYIWQDVKRNIFSFFKISFSPRMKKMHLLLLGLELNGGSIKMDSRWSFTGIYLILEWFWDLCMLALWIQKKLNLFGFGLVSRTYFPWFPNRNFDAWDFQIEVFAWKVLQKLIFHGNRF